LFKVKEDGEFIEKICIDVKVSKKRSRKENVVESVQPVRNKKERCENEHKKGRLSLN
jgi:hypothetical protein